MTVAALSASSSDTTLCDLIADTRGHLLGMHREDRNSLASTISDADTTLTFTGDVTKIKERDFLSLGFEIVYVQSVNAGASTATVLRAQEGSDAAEHLAGTVVYINARFPDFIIRRAINQELRALSPRLYCIRSVEITYDTAVNTYDFADSTPGSVLEVQEIVYDQQGEDRRWPRIPEYRVLRDMPTADFPSATALRIESGWGESGRRIIVNYRSTFSPLTNCDDNVEEVSGLFVEAHDIPPMGAALRLMTGREIKRNFTEAQPDPRRAADVPPGAVSSSSTSLRREYQRRVGEEYRRLVSRHGMGGA